MYGRARAHKSYRQDQDDQDTIWPLRPPPRSVFVAYAGLSVQPCHAQFYPPTTRSGRAPRRAPSPGGSGDR